MSNNKCILFEIDTSIYILPTDFSHGRKIVETMTLNEITNFINREKSRGSSNIEKYEIEKYKRYAGPFATFILTLIGVSLATRKARGGIGLHLGVGILLSFLPQEALHLIGKEDDLSFILVCCFHFLKCSRIAAFVFFVCE